jgi:uncharacterized membrane protein YdjX (TVP38/TMEM64 family)
LKSWTISSLFCFVFFKISALAWVPCFLTSHSQMTNVWNVKKYGANAGPSTRLQPLTSSSSIALAQIVLQISRKWFVTKSLNTLPGYFPSAMLNCFCETFTLTLYNMCVCVISELN